jgi:hypothetical protein
MIDRTAIATFLLFLLRALESVFLKPLRAALKELNEIISPPLNQRIIVQRVTVAIGAIIPM